MGIRGLTTYISNHSDVYLENFDLNNTYLVVDGCSAAAQIYRRTKKSDSFGGDYDIYRRDVELFFKNLIKCNVTPLVIIDGGMEYKKYKTTMSRLINKLQTIVEHLPSNQDCYQVMPIMQMKTFVETVIELNIKLVVSDFEADYEIASLARQLNCPVLSLDSDFFVYDCLYIPFPSLDFHPHIKNDQFTMSCKIYRVENLLRHMSIKKELLPLLATLLGNDYVSKSTFNAFFSQLKLQSSRQTANDQQRTIMTLLDWLRPHNFETAVERILNRFKMHQRQRVLNAINESVRGYHTSANHLLEAFGLAEATQTVDDTYTLFDSSDRNEVKYHVPRWFIDKYRSGKMHAIVINLITKQLLLMSPQIEDFSLPTSHKISFRIVEVLMGLVSSDKNYQTFHALTRVGSKITRVQLTPVYTLNSLPRYPPLEQFHSIPKDVQINILLETLYLSRDDLSVINSLPKDWIYGVLIIVYWGRNFNDLPLTAEHIVALLLCVVYLKCIDDKAGFYRSHGVFKHHFREKLARLKETNTNEMATIEITASLSRMINQLTKNEACQLANILLPYFQLDMKLVHQSKYYSKRTIHCFAAFQSAFLFTSYLNSLLDYPFEYDRVRFNGTFVYNMYVNLKKRKNLFEYLDNYIFIDTPIVRLIFYKVFNILEKLLPHIFVQNKSNKKH